MKTPSRDFLKESMDANRKLKSLLFKKGKIENEEIESIVSKLDAWYFVTLLGIEDSISCSYAVSNNLKLSVCLTE